MLVWFLFGFMCAAAAVLAAAYFKFVSLRKAVRRAWLRLDAALKNRCELVPQLSLAGAAFEELERASLCELNAVKEKCRICDTMQKRIACEEEVSRGFARIFDAAAKREALKTDEHFIKLQRGVLSAESKVQNCKKRYNSAVRDFNTLAEIAPLSLVARMLEFDKFEYFDFTVSLDKILQ